MHVSERMRILFFPKIWNFEIDCQGFLFILLQQLYCADVLMDGSSSDNEDFEGFVVSPEEKASYKVWTRKRRASEALESDSDDGMSGDDDEEDENDEADDDGSDDSAIEEEEEVEGLLL